MTCPTTKICGAVATIDGETVQCFMAENHPGEPHHYLDSHGNLGSFTVHASGPKLLAPPVKSQPAPEPPTTLFGLKSLSHAGVFNPASEAPYGYDPKTDLPIKPLRFGFADSSLRCVEAAPRPSAEELEELERHRKLDKERKRAEEEELRERERKQFERDLERLTHFREFANMKGIPSSPRPDLSAWGFERRKPAPYYLGDPTAVPRYHYPTLLGLTREQLVALFDIQVGVEEQTVVDPTKELRTIVVPERKVVLASPRFFEMTEELKGLDKQIADSEKLLATYNVAAEKRAVKRGEIKPESARDAKTFKRLRAEESHILEQLKKKRSALKTEVDAEAKRLDDFTRTIPEHTVDAFVTMVVQKPILFRDIFDVPADFDYSSYVEAVKRNDSHAFMNFENEIVVQALGRRVLPLPSNEILEKFLPYDVATITRYMTGIVPESTKPAEETEEEDDDGGHDPREIALTLKQGGANIGGQVYGAGTDGKGKKRSLSGFTKVIGKRRGDRGDEAEEHEDAAEDYSEHGPGDDGEAHEPD